MIYGGKVNEDVTCPQQNKEIWLWYIEKVLSKEWLYIYRVNKSMLVSNPSVK
jgi:hypothetical protein